MKQKRLLVVLVGLMLVLTACAKAAATPMPTYYEEKAYDNGFAGAVPESADQAMESPAAAPQADRDVTAGGTAAFKQMIIMNADLGIAVDDPGLTMTNISKLAEGMGGFTVSSYVYKTQTSSGLEVPEANITIRVPAAKLNEALDKIKAMTGDVSKYTLSENISGQDVTQEYTDLQSRLKNLQEADAKLTELYDDAVKTEDALAIYTQKMQVTEQIEIIKGQMQYYEQSSDMSAISVRIVAKETIEPISVAGWQPKGVARDALQALINFGKGLVEFLIWLIILVVPILALIGVPVYFIVRGVTKRNKQKASARAEALRQAMANQQPPDIKK